MPEQDLEPISMGLEVRCSNALPNELCVWSYPYSTKCAIILEPLCNMVQNITFAVSLFGYHCTTKEMFYLQTQESFPLERTSGNF